jgi:RNA 2',3'-cyclic 3'-phosphodiesterase
MPEAYRAFVALTLPEALREYLRGVQRCLSDNGVRARWVQPASMHLTLKFLGQLPLHQVAAVIAALDRVADDCPPLQLTADELGGFPHRYRPRVLWMGIGGEHERLCGLQEAIEAALATLGWSPEKRPYRGHLTLARAKGQRPLDKNVGDILTRCTPRGAMAFQADRLVLFRSRLQPGGAVHDKLKEWVLSNRAPQLTVAGIP